MGVILTGVAVASLFLEIISPTQADVGLQRNTDDPLERGRIGWKGKSFSRLTSIAVGEQKISPD
jgi:hypothetical protein